MTETIAEVNQSHLDISRNLRYAIESLLCAEDLGTGPRGRVSRSAVELSQALEKVQKIERMALGADQGRAASGVTNVVILVPDKLQSEEWEQKVQEPSLTNGSGD